MATNHLGEVVILYYSLKDDVNRIGLFSLCGHCCLPIEVPVLVLAGFPAVTRGRDRLTFTVRATALSVRHDLISFLRRQPSCLTPRFLN